MSLLSGSSQDVRLKTLEAGLAFISTSNGGAISVQEARDSGDIALAKLRKSAILTDLLTSNSGPMIMLALDGEVHSLCEDILDHNLCLEKDRDCLDLFCTIASHDRRTTLVSDKINMLSSKWNLMDGKAKASNSCLRYVIGQLPQPLVPPFMASKEIGTLLQAVPEHVHATVQDRIKRSLYHIMYLFNDVWVAFPDDIPTAESVKLKQKILNEIRYVEESEFAGDFDADDESLFNIDEFDAETPLKICRRVVAMWNNRYANNVGLKRAASTEPFSIAKKKRIAED